MLFQVRWGSWLAVVWWWHQSDQSGQGDWGGRGDRGDQGDLGDMASRERRVSEEDEDTDPGLTDPFLQVFFQQIIVGENKERKNTQAF